MDGDAGDIVFDERPTTGDAPHPSPGMMTNSSEPTLSGTAVGPGAGTVELETTDSKETYPSVTGRAPPSLRVQPTPAPAVPRPGINLRNRRRPNMGWHGLALTATQPVTDRRRDRPSKTSAEPPCFNVRFAER